MRPDAVPIPSAVAGALIALLASVAVDLFLNVSYPPTIFDVAELSLQVALMVGVALRWYWARFLVVALLAYGNWLTYGMDGDLYGEMTSAKLWDYFGTTLNVVAVLCLFTGQSHRWFGGFRWPLGRSNDGRDAGAPPN